MVALPKHQNETSHTTFALIEQQQQKKNPSNTCLSQWDFTIKAAGAYLDRKRSSAHQKRPAWALHTKWQVLRKWRFFFFFVSMMEEALLLRWRCCLQVPLKANLTFWGLLFTGVFVCWGTCRKRMAGKSCCSVFCGDMSVGEESSGCLNARWGTGDGFECFGKWRVVWIWCGVMVELSIIQRNF